MKTLVAALTIALTASAANAQFHNVTSGMLLGVYCKPCVSGMRITSLIPGYSAEGRLMPGDILTRATIDGSQFFDLKSHYQMEQVKTLIGPYRDAAIEFYRPGYGYDAVWVQFTPIYGPASPYGAPAARSQTQNRTFGAQFKSEREKPGARALFGRPGIGQPAAPISPVSPVNPGFTSIPKPGKPGSAASLFGR